MTLEELCECSAEQLKAMSDEELLKHFQNYLCVTRPEQAAKPRSEPSTPPVYISPQKKAALAALAAEGVDVSFMRRKKR